MDYLAHRYQDRATQFVLDHTHSALMLGCGLGKSVVTLTAISELYARQQIGSVLIIAPLRVARSVWKQEAAKWEHTKHLNVSLVLGTPTQRKKALNTPADIYVINIDNLRWLTELFGKKWPFDFVVCDEFSLFKSPSAKTRFKALKKVLPYIDSLVGLTGTPAPNGLLDLFSQVYLLDQGKRLGKTITSYKNTYFDSDYMGYTFTPKVNADEIIHSKIKDICLSMSAEEYLDLPDQFFNTIEVELPDEAKRDYEELEKEMYLQLEESEIVALNAAALSNKCLQYCNGAVYTDAQGSWEPVHSAKLDALEEIVEGAAGAPVLVAYNYKSDLARLQQRFKRAAVLDKNTATIDKWNEGKLSILLAHPASAGHGLNLQAGGNILVWFGMTWSLELYEQFNARLYRQAQTQPVFVHHLLCKDTVDERVLWALENKATVQDALLKAVKDKAA